MVSVEERLNRVEAGLRRWKAFSICLAVTLVAVIFVGGGEPQNGTPEKVTLKEVDAELIRVNHIVLQDWQNLGKKPMGRMMSLECNGKIGPRIDMDSQKEDFSGGTLTLQATDRGALIWGHRCSPTTAEQINGDPDTNRMRLSGDRLDGFKIEVNNEHAQFYAGERRAGDLRFNSDQPLPRTFVIDGAPKE